MKPYAKYVFEQLPESKTRFILREHSGADIPNFPAVWKQKGHPHQGEKYIVFRETQDNHPRVQYSHSLSLEKNRMCTSFNFIYDFPMKARGDYGDDAVLIQFSEDQTVLTIWFFENMKNQGIPLLMQWKAGELELS
jgi:hypothetical protein